MYYHERWNDRPRCTRYSVETAAKAVSLRMHRVRKLVFGTAWYHEASARNIIDLHRLLRIVAQLVLWCRARSERIAEEVYRHGTMR